VNAPGWILALSVAAAAAGAIAVAVLERRRARTLARRLEHSAQELERLQTAFSRFAPEAVVDEIAARGVSPKARECEITVLFADLKGFTTMSERMAPDVLVEVLNGYFARMSRAITDHRGHVSKFIGDGLMALFGALEPNPWQCNDAVRAALAMRAALESYNESLRARALPELAFGVGIHRGKVVAGILGSESLMEFTVIGDTVNTASRVESMTRAHGVDVIVTESVREALDPRFGLVALPPTPVKGKAEPIMAYALLGEGD
jgi:adenylate cyclase